MWCGRFWFTLGDVLGLAGEPADESCEALGASEFVGSRLGRADASFALEDRRSIEGVWPTMRHRLAEGGYGVAQPFELFDAELVVLDLPKGRFVEEDHGWFTQGGEEQVFHSRVQCELPEEHLTAIPLEASELLAVALPAPCL